ncbi:MAG: OsmC family protein [Nitrosomonadaceae bacterium]|nr:OsmC family protein [Nitrosomonadaceae bacterium]
MTQGHRKENLVAEISAGKHRLISGVPEELGGHDEGLGPHELLEAALAACTIITLQMYANRKHWNLLSADVTVNIDSENDRESYISRKIRLQGDLTEEQRKSLIAIANKCPIHKVLSSKITIKTDEVISV